MPSVLIVIMELLQLRSQKLYMLELALVFWRCLSICINFHDPFLQLTALTEEALFRRK